MDATSKVPAAPPLLVVLLAGNSVTAVGVLACLCMADARALRRVQPAIAAVVRMVPWTDDATPVTDVVRWRAALPAAVGVTLRRLENKPAATAALAGLVSLCVAGCDAYAGITDTTLAGLPATLRVLDVTKCSSLTRRARFDHLVGLEELTCTSTAVVEGGVTRMPPSLRVLRIDKCALPAAANFSHLVALRVLSGVHGSSVTFLPPSLQELDVSQLPHNWYHLARLHEWPCGAPPAYLTQLRVLNAAETHIDDASVAALPPSLRVLDVSRCKMMLTAAVSFAHLPHLHTLRVTHTDISDATIASLPPSLAYLHMAKCCNMTLGAVLPALPALRELDVGSSDIGNAMVASMPPGLTHLCMADCSEVTHGAIFDHLVGLQVFQCSGTDISPDVLTAYHSRGCWVPAAGALCSGVPLPGHVYNMALLRDGWIVCVTFDLSLTAWNYTRAQKPAVMFATLVTTAVIDVSSIVCDGERVITGMAATTNDSDNDTKLKGALVSTYVDENLSCAPAGGTVKFQCGVCCLAVLSSGRIVAGLCDASMYITGPDGGHTIRPGRHFDKVVALAELPGGTLASGSLDRTVCLWDVEAKRCIATLAGHTAAVNALAALPDGTLASGSDDASVRLRVTGTGTGSTSRFCIDVLAAGAPVTALATLEGGWLAAGCANGTIRVWDTRRCRAGPQAAPSQVFNAHRKSVTSLLSLPDGRLASLSGSDTVRLWCMPPRPPPPPPPPTSSSPAAGSNDSDDASGRE